MLIDVFSIRHEVVQKPIDFAGGQAHRVQMLCPHQNSLISNDCGNAYQRRDTSCLNPLQQNPRRPDCAAQPAQEHIRIEHQPHIVYNIILTTEFKQTSGAMRFGIAPLSGGRPRCGGVTSVSTRWSQPKHCAWRRERDRSLLARSRRHGGGHGGGHGEHGPVRSPCR